MSQVVTPVQVERRLVELSKELDASHAELVKAEEGYFHAKGAYEVKLAHERIRIGRQMADMGAKSTAQEREDLATQSCKDELLGLYAAEAVVKAARANAARIRTQIDIARSVGTSVRASMEV